MSGLNAYDEGKRRGKDRADFERGYAEAHQGVNAGDTPGSGIRGSGGLSPKPSIDVATTDPRYFRGGSLKQDVLIAGANPGSRTANTVNVNSVMDGRMNGGPDASAVKIPEAVAATPAPANPAPEKSMTNWGTANAPRQIGFREAGFNSQMEMDAARYYQPQTEVKAPSNPAWQQAQANANTQAAATRQRLDQAGTHETGFALGNAIRADTIAQAQKSMATPSRYADPAASASAAAGQAALIGRVNDQQTAANDYQQDWRAGQAAQANSVPMTKAPAADSITAVSTQPQQPAQPQQIKGYLPNGLPEQGYKGSALAGMTNDQVDAFFKANPQHANPGFIKGYGATPAPAPAQTASAPAATPAPQVASAHPDSENPATDRETTSEAGEKAGAKVVAAAPSPVDNSTAGMAPAATIKGLGQRAGQGLDNLMTNTTASNPAMFADTALRYGGAVVKGLWDGDFSVPDKSIVHQAGDAIGAALAPSIPAPAPRQVAQQLPSNQSPIMESPVMPAPPEQAVASYTPPVDYKAPQATVSAYAKDDARLAAQRQVTPQVAATPTPPFIIKSGPDPVQPMEPQSVANMDVPTLFKRPGGVRGQSRTSVIKPTPFYQI